MLCFRVPRCRVSGVSHRLHGSQAAVIDIQTEDIGMNGRHIPPNVIGNLGKTITKAVHW